MEYQTSGGYGSGTNHRGFGTQSGVGHNETYSSMGGKVNVRASVNCGEQDEIQITITGVPIPDATITSRLKSLYDPEPGGTDSICCGIASKESSYIQFYRFHTLYGRTDRWPHESYDGGTHIGFMMVQTTFVRAWNWLTNTSDGVGWYEANIAQSHTHENNVQAAHPGLRDLTAIEHENNASAIYRTGKYYYVWNGDDTNPDWEENPNNSTGVNYADDVRIRAGGY